MTPWYLHRSQVLLLFPTLEGQPLSETGIVLIGVIEYES